VATATGRNWPDADGPPSRTHWPLLLQSCPSRENSTPGNRAAASAWPAPGSNGRFQEPRPSTLGRKGGFLKAASCPSNAIFGWTVG